MLDTRPMCSKYPLRRCMNRTKNKYSLIKFWYIGKGSVLFSQARQRPKVTLIDIVPFTFPCSPRSESMNVEMEIPPFIQFNTYIHI